MLEFLQYIARSIELVVNIALWFIRIPLRMTEFIPRLPTGLRLIILPFILYISFAFVLVYPFAYVRGWAGQVWYSEKLRYAEERWQATALYDYNGNFAGTFDPRMDSKLDVNYTGKPIVLDNENYTAAPDHKSIPVQKVPEHYWKCVQFHEDRHIGSWINPYGIDLYGVLKIPYSTFKRSVEARSLKMGVGGSTLSMQLVRANFKLIPSRHEGVSGKLTRKFVEWWHAPVIFRSLTRQGNLELLQKWVSDHLPLAQRTGGPPLYGVEQTSRVVFGKPAKETTIAEQFVLAAAVNHPIILLKGSKNLNRIRFGAWQRLTLERAHACAVILLSEGGEQLAVIESLDKIGSGPPDPKSTPHFDDTIQKLSPRHVDRARANPFLRAHILAPAIRYGARKEMENIYGYSWRQYVRGVNLTINLTENLKFRHQVEKKLATLQTKYSTRISPDYSLDIAKSRSARSDKSIPDIVVVAANEKGQIIRYYDAGYNASYYGSWKAFDRQTGGYVRENETRAIASVGKMLAAIALANQGRDNLNSLYLDKFAPERGLESCRRRGKLRRGRRAEVVFACSLSAPLEHRLAKLSQTKNHKLIRKLGYNLPFKYSDTDATPPSTAIVRGLVTSSPRNVHHTAGLILASLIGRAHIPLPEPTMVRRFDQNDISSISSDSNASTSAIVPASVIRSENSSVLREFLSAPLCYQNRKNRYGTLKSLGDWCAKRRADVKLHFAKTGTQVNLDKNATVDVWLAGGVQFINGKAFSYVILVGTGNSDRPFGQNLHAANLAAPLARVLLQSLKREATVGKVAELGKTITRKKTRSSLKVQK